MDPESAFHHPSDLHSITRFTVYCSEHFNKIMFNYNSIIGNNKLPTTTGNKADDNSGSDNPS